MLTCQVQALQKQQAKRARSEIFGGLDSKNDKNTDAFKEPNNNAQYLDVPVSKFDELALKVYSIKSTVDCLK